MMAATTLPTLLLGGDPDGRPRRDLRGLAGGSGAAVGPRPGGRARPALPGRRRRGQGGRHRRLAGAAEEPVDDVELVPARRRCRRRTVRPRDHARLRRLGLLQPAGAHPRRRAPSTASTPAPTRCIVVPLSGGAVGDDRRARPSTLAGRPTCSPDRPTSPTSRRVPPPTLASDRRRPVRPVRRPTDATLPVALRRRGRGAGRAPRRRAVQPAGPQLRHAAGAFGRRRDHRLRGDHARRELVVLPGPQARRGHRDRVGARGDLLLRDRRRPERRAGLRLHADARPRRATRSTCCEEVHDRDTVLVPYGWHGPCVAAPGHDMYYLNVMAGRRRDERAWKISDHPDQTWVRGTWADQPVDPRLDRERTPDHGRRDRAT